MKDLQEAINSDEKIDWNNVYIKRKESETAMSEDDNYFIPKDAQERKNTPIFQGVIKYFPDALGEVAKLSRQGNIQHGLGSDGVLVWQKDISSDHLDAMMRHLCDSVTNPVDTDGVHHDVKIVWRALANLQIRLEGPKNK